MDGAISHCRNEGVAVEKRPPDPVQNGKGFGTNPPDHNSSPCKTDGQAKGFLNNLHLAIGKDGGQLISLDKSHNGDNVYDQETNDGTDSGVEVIRALSSNGSNSDRFTPIQSCGSSLVSYTSEPEIDRGSDCGSESSEKSRVRKGSDCWSPKVFGKTDRSRIGSRKGSGYEGGGTSESCSETSSTHEAVTPDQLSRSLDFKRCASSRLHEAKKCDSGKASAGRRSESSTRNSSYEKLASVRSHSSVRSSSTSSGSKSLSGSRGVKSAVGGKCEAKGSRSRADLEGRWSSGGQKRQANGARIRVSSVADPSRRIVHNQMSCSMTSSFNGGCGKTSEAKSNALDKYGTLPRRPKKKSAECSTAPSTSTSLTRSSSVSREPSLNRAATLRRQQSREKENALNSKSLPPYPRARRGTGKVIIYHEVSVQTIITGQDISTTSNGVSISDRAAEAVVKKESRGIQTEGKERLKKIEESYAKQTEDVENLKKENEELRSEAQKMASRIFKLLGYKEAQQGEVKGNGLDELEQHFQAVGLTVMKQQEELSELRHYKRIAHRDLEKSLAAQKNLLQQQQEIEEEYTELQEFLQAEKTALSESLLDTEEELTRLRNEVAKKESLLEQQQEECKHLVRICEQRRQENLSLEAKLAGLDQRSRDVLVQQGAAVSAAAVALSGLGARLDTLVEQVSVSCNISEKDLEDAVYHNEVYNKSADSSPVRVPSRPESKGCPKRRESFLQVVLGAIKNAAHSSFASKKDKKLPDQSAETFFESETETSLNLETALEENSSLSDYGSCSEMRREEPEEGVPSEEGLSRSRSLQNLSDAILNRQMVEKNERFVALDKIIPIEVNSLVDQIVEVDNLVTKLLKVIKIIQGESQREVEELQGEREDLTGQLQQEKMNRQNLEDSLQTLQHELTEARSQLNAQISQLEEVKVLCGESQRVAVVEMEKRFAIIDTALGALNLVQDVVNQCPQLAKLRHDLEDCSFGRTPAEDVNANPPTAGQDVTRNGAVLTTAV